MLKKRIKFTKRPKANTIKQYGKLKQQLREEILSEKLAGRDLLYLDETMFTSKTVPLKEWATKGNNITAEEESINEPAYALLMAISTTVPVEHAKVFKKSVNIDKFLCFVDEL